MQMSFGSEAPCVMAHQLALDQTSGSENRDMDDELGQEGEGGGGSVAIRAKGFSCYQV